ncbi:TetR/AcrR family transcriptional regulator [Xanthobacter sp. TB0139]|uniref:TetR/AcrR family transcriptional regulator n=1 Tax=Xanthobacter sp. TB0139 TaxID=3459178 RepID=UPI004039805D
MSDLKEAPEVHASEAQPSPTEEGGCRRASIGARRNPETQAAILEAGRSLLAEKGYAGFSIDAVARRAGAGKPTIYRWWPSKADLFIEIYSQEKRSSLLLPDHGCLLQDLETYTCALWRYWQETPCGSTFRALVAEAQASATALDSLRNTFMPRRLKDAHTLFSRAAARGEVQAGAVDMLVQLYIGFNWLHLLTGQLEEKEGEIRAMAQLLAAAGKNADMPDQ